MEWYKGRKNANKTHKKTKAETDVFRLCLFMRRIVCRGLFLLVKLLLLGFLARDELVGERGSYEE